MSLYSPTVDKRTTNKEIKVNSSSLVDLKAELYKKQEQYERLKANPTLHSHQASTTTTEKKSLWAKQNKGVNERSKNDTATMMAIDSTDLRYEESRRALEAKAQLYDKLQSANLHMTDQDSKYLVDFTQKPVVSKEPAHTSALSSYNIANFKDEDLLGDPEEPLEFTDSLGRTRICKRKELKELLAIDNELGEIERSNRERSRHASRGKRRSHSRSGSESEDEGRRFSDSFSEDEEGLVRDPRNSSFVNVAPPSSYRYESKSSDRRERDRARHHSKKKTTAEKSSRHTEEPFNPTMRFQTALGNEIRVLGVGYFNFSTDEEERNRQMNMLNSLREQTLAQRKSRELLKEKRNQIIQNRLQKIQERKALKESQRRELLSVDVQDTSDSTDKEVVMPTGLQVEFPIKQVEEDQESEDNVSENESDIEGEESKEPNKTNPVINNQAIDQFLTFFKNKAYQ